MTAGIHAVDFDFAGERRVVRLGCHCLADLVREHESRLRLHSRSRASWRAERPFAAFVTMQIAASRSVNLSLRLWKIVPDVTLYCAAQSAHLKRRRVVIR